MPPFHCLSKYLLLKELKNRLSQTHAILLNGKKTFNRYACADPENFVRGVPPLTRFFLFFLLVDEGR